VLYVGRWVYVVCVGRKVCVRGEKGGMTSVKAVLQ